MCCAITIGTGNFIGSRERMIESASGPPVEAARAATTPAVVAPGGGAGTGSVARLP
jgi:hypothetical protein